MVSAFLKIKPFPLFCIATRQLEPHELDNVVSSANVFMTKMWMQEVLGNSRNLWEFFYAGKLLAQSFTEIIVSFSSLSKDCVLLVLEHGHTVPDKIWLKLNLSHSFQVFEFVFATPTGRNLGF